MSNRFMQTSKDDCLINACVEWDTINWSKAVAFWEASLKLENANYMCLELGGHSGGMSLWLAARGNKVICSDLQNPEKIAGNLHKKFDTRYAITYQAIDATNIPFESHFDIVVFKSILGGISRNGNSHLNQVVIDQIYKALKPNGKVLFAENLEATSVHRFVRKKFTAWGRYWNYLSLNDMKLLFRKFERMKYDTAGFLGTFGRTENQRRLLGKIDTLFFDRTLPDNMKYIVYGIATKSK